MRPKWPALSHHLCTPILGSVKCKPLLSWEMHLQGKVMMLPHRCPQYSQQESGRWWQTQESRCQVSGSWGQQTLFSLHSPVDTHHTYIGRGCAFWAVYIEGPTVFRSPQGGRGKGHWWVRLGQREGRASGPGDGWSSILAGKVPKKGYASAFLSETDPFSLGNPAVYQGKQN